MPPLMTVTFDRAKMKAIERALAEHPRTLPRIVYRALKRTTAAGRTLLDRELRQRITAKKADVMRRIVQIEKPSYSHWVSRLGLSSKRLALTAFRYRVSKRRGVSYAIRPGVTERIPQAFERTMEAAGTEDGGSRTYKAIFRRAGRQGELVPRYPLVFLRGPSIGQVVADAPELLQQAHRDGQQRLTKEISSQVDLELSKRWPK